jgi:hypothetical protein
VQGAGDPALGREVLNSLAQMPRGDAYVWSPEVGFGPTRLTFPMFTTFDSFAPPQLQQKVSQEGWASVDLSEVEAKLATVIAAAKANDPTELKQQIAALKQELRAAQSSKSQVETKEIEVPMITDAQIKRVQAACDTARMVIEEAEKIAARLEAAAEEIKTAMHDLGMEVNVALQQQTKQNTQARAAQPAAQTARQRPQRSQPVPPTRSPHAGGDSSLGKGEKRVLIAIAQYDEGVTREQLTILTGYKRSSRDTYIQRLRQNNFVEQAGERVQATQAGVEALGDDYEPLPTGEELQRYWLDRLSGGERLLFDLIVQAYPDSISREELGDSSGYKRSSRDTYLQRLSARRLIVPESGGMVRAASMLFD